MCYPPMDNWGKCVLRTLCLREERNVGNRGPFAILLVPAIVGHLFSVAEASAREFVADRSILVMPG